MEQPEEHQYGDDTDFPVQFLEESQCDISHRFDDSLHKRLLSGNKQSGNWSTSSQKEVELLSILHKAKAPLYLYDLLMRWARDARDEEYSFNSKPRKTVLESLYKKFDVQGIRPWTVPVQLTRNQTVKVVVHDFREAVYMLLNDPTLVSDENLIFKGQTPMVAPDPKPDKLDDVDTGAAYISAWKKYCTGSQDVLCPLIFFIDKTTTDLHGNLTLESVFFTLGIFNRKTRRSPHAWMSLGNVINQSRSEYKKKSSQERLDDYHRVLSVLFTDVKKVQRDGGLSFEIPYKGSRHSVVLKMPVLFIVGDTEGQDRLACRFSNRSAKVKKLCRYCTVSTDDADDPEATWYRLDHAAMQNLVDKGDAASLQNLSFHCLKSALADLQFCDHVHGLYGSLPAEIIHTWQHGLCRYCLACFFQIKRIRHSGVRWKPGTQYGHQFATVYNPEDHEENSFRVFSKKFAQDYEKLTKMLGKLLQHQSDRDLPRTSFPQGIVPSDTRKKNPTPKQVKENNDPKDNQNDTRGRRVKGTVPQSGKVSAGSEECALKKNAHEIQGVLLLVALTLVTRFGRTTMDKLLGSERAMTWLGTIEQLMMWEEFLKKEDGFNRADMRPIKKFVPAVLDRFKRTINRTHGNALKIIKFHLPLHLVEDILQFGAPENSNTGPSESNHKTKCKHPARNTQRRADTFDLQSSRGMCDGMVICRATRAIAMHNHPSHAAPSLWDHSHPVPGTKMMVPVYFYHPKAGGIVDCSARKRKDWFLTIPFTTTENHTRETNLRTNDEGDHEYHPPSDSDDEPEEKDLEAIDTNTIDTAEVQGLNEYLREMHPVQTQVPQSQWSHLPALQVHDLCALLHQCSINCDNQPVGMYLACQKNGVIYRADPRSKRQWHDWVEIQWQYNDSSRKVQIPMHLMFFIDLKGLKSSFVWNECHVDSVGYYAVGHGLAEPLKADGTDAVDPESRLFRAASKWCDTTTGRPRVQLAPVANLGSPVLAVPDIDLDPMGNPITTPDHNYIFIYSRSTWASKFVDYAKETNTKKRGASPSINDTEDAVDTEDEQQAEDALNYSSSSSEEENVEQDYGVSAAHVVGVASMPTAKRRRR